MYRAVRDVRPSGPACEVDVELLLPAHASFAEVAEFVFGEAPKAFAVPLVAGSVLEPSVRSVAVDGPRHVVTLSYSLGAGDVVPHLAEVLLRTFELAAEDAIG